MPPRGTGSSRWVQSSRPRPSLAVSCPLTAEPRLTEPDSLFTFLGKLFPEQQARFSEPSTEVPEAHYGWDLSRAKEVLGVKFKSLKETIREAAEQAFELEKVRA